MSPTKRAPRRTRQDDAKTETVEQKWAAYERALIITAHPDDAEFLAGGMIAKMCDLGWDVRICVATSGDKGTRDPNMRPQELAATREAEQRAAAQVLGLRECIFWGYPDGLLIETPDLRGQVVALIRRLKPDVVISWDGFRAGFNHHDHRAIGRVVHSHHANELCQEPVPFVGLCRFHYHIAQCLDGHGAYPFTRSRKYGRSPPPSTLMRAPLTHDARPEHSQSTAPAMSSPVPMR